MTIGANDVMGSFSQTVMIDIIEDTILEFDEEFDVSFNTMVTPFGVTFSVPSSTTTITIVDDGKHLIPHDIYNL